MTLDFSDLIKKALIREFDVSHITDIKFLFNTRDGIAGSSSGKKIIDGIKRKYGNSFLSDADCILFVKTPKDAFKDIKIKTRVAQAIRRAMGDSANNMNVNEFNEISLVENKKSDFFFVKITTKF